jgi:hypothetical protein
MKKSDIAIATPCGQDWQSMSPRERSRFCGECKKLVHDLSSLKEKEAKKLLSTRSTEGLCVRYMYDEQGNVWFQDSMFMRTEGLLKKVAAAAALAAAPFLTACMGTAVGTDFSSNDHAQVDPAVSDPSPEPLADAGARTDAAPNTDAAPSVAADGGADSATDPAQDPDAGGDPAQDPDAAVDPGPAPEADAAPPADDVDAGPPCGHPR